MNILRKIHYYLYRLSTVKYILITTICNYILTLSISVLLYFANFRASDTPFYSNTVIQFLSSVIVSPMVETFLFQMVVILIIRDLIGVKNIAIQIIVSALAFGILHLPYGVLHMITAFIAGFLFAYTYIIYERKEMHPFWVVASIHSLSNFISLFLLLL